MGKFFRATFNSRFYALSIGLTLGTAWGVWLMNKHYVLVSMKGR